MSIVFEHSPNSQEPSSKGIVFAATGTSSDSMETSSPLASGESSAREDGKLHRNGVYRAAVKIKVNISSVIIIE